MVAVRSFHKWAFRVDVRWLIAFHMTRFIGIYFLYLYAQHELPYAFSIVGGTGDIIIAVLALIIIRFASYKPALFAWNVIGLLDIVAVAVMAAQSEMAIPGSMHQLDKFPLVLLPTFIVPVIIVTHGLILVRIFKPEYPRKVY